METVGWNYVGFKVYKLKTGEKVFENTARDEAIIVFLEGYGAASTDSEELGKLGTRHSVFEKKPFAVKDGGSIPIIAQFEKILGVKTILMGFGLDSDAIHSPNEHFGISNFYNGIETISNFYNFYSSKV